jgi:uncharacterized protein
MQVGVREMDLRTRLQADVTEAMRQGDSERRGALRMLLAAVKQVEVDERRTVSDDDVAAVIAKQAKQLRESIADAQKAGRPAMAAQAQAELDIVESYLPKMLTREEIEAIASRAIAEVGVTDPKGMGQVMSRLMPEVKGKADGRLVTEVVRELLQKRA